MAVALVDAAVVAVIAFGFGFAFAFTFTFACACACACAFAFAFVAAVGLSAVIVIASSSACRGNSRVGAEGPCAGCGERQIIQALEIGPRTGYRKRGQIVSAGVSYIFSEWVKEGC